MKRGIIYCLAIVFIALVAGCAHVTEPPPAALPEAARVEETAPPSVAELEEEEVTPPAEALYHYVVGRTKVSAGDWEGAIQAYEQAIAVDNQSPLLYVELASLYLGKGRIEEAMGVCRNALILDPDYLSAHYLLGGVYSAMGRYREAISQME